MQRYKKYVDVWNMQTVNVFFLNNFKVAIFPAPINKEKDDNQPFKKD
jgi:hypothetical protein